MSVIQCIAALEQTNSRTDKEAILTEYKDNAVVRFILEAAYNPFKRFNINSKIDEFVGTGTEACDIGTLDTLLTNLMLRNLSGNEAVESVRSFLSPLRCEHAEIVKRTIKKDLRCGISDSTINKVFKDLIPTFDVQLAAKPERLEKMKYRAYAEPKKDGMRCLALYDGLDVEFLSRTGKPITTLDYMKEEVLKLCAGVPWVFDAEAMTDTFNDSMSSVKRKTAKNQNAKLYIFDGMSYEDFTNGRCDVTQEKRKETLQAQFAAGEFNTLRLNKWIIVENEEEAFEAYELFRAEGDEGAIIKAMDAPYFFKRNDNWIKIKPLETSDFEITGMEEGSGRNKGRMGAFLFDFKGVECKCGMGFSDDERIDFWNRRAELCGYIFEADFMEETSNKEGTSRTRHCRFKRLRSIAGSKA